MSYDYTRTVSITPVSTSYSWDATPNWITITRVSVNSDDWTITLQENTGDARSATLTVRHANSTTVDTITVNQAEGVGAPDPTATPVPTSVPTATPAPTNAPNPTPVPPTATPVPTPVPPTATPVPTAQPTPGPNPTFTFATNTTSSNRFIFAPSSLNTDVSYTIVADGNTSPAAPSNFSTGGVSGSNQTGPTVTNNSNVFTGTYRFTKTFSPVSDLNVNCTVSAPYGTSDTWYCTLEADSGPKNTATPSPTTGSGGGSGPTATPVPNPTATPFQFPTPTPTTFSGGGGGGGGCHVAGELLTLANGETKLVEDVVVGDNLLSVNFDGFSLDGEWKSWKRREETLEPVYTNTTVTNVTVLDFDKYYDFNNGLLKITEEHPVLVKDTVGDIYFKQVKNIVNSDWLLNEDNEWVDITSIELIAVPERFTTYSFDVEESDVYFANGIIVHNVEDLERDDQKLQ